MTDRELFIKALNALETQKPFWVWTAYRCEPLEIQDAITALRDRLAQPEQEPVAWAGVDFDIKTTPPQRKSLTDEVISNIWCKVSNTDFVTADTHEFARAIEAAHGIKP